MKLRLTKDLYNTNMPYLKNKDMGGWHNKIPYFFKSTITIRQTL